MPKLNNPKTYQCRKCKDYFRTYYLAREHKCIEDLAPVSDLEKKDRIEWCHDKKTTTKEKGL